MRRTFLLLLVLAVGVGVCQAAACPDNMVQSGDVCVDKYEVSVWYATNRRAVDLIKGGHATVAQLIAAGAVQKGIDSTGFDFGPTCKFNGAGCKDVYALSLPDVVPSQYMNWFLAAAVCRNSEKRLLTNAEWQVAALGTPDPGVTDPGANDNTTTECNIGTSGALALTGARSACVSDVGANDMVGNLVEFVGDWGAVSSTGQSWNFAPSSAGLYASDSSIVGGGGVGNPFVGLPAATLRGGSYQNGALFPASRAATSGVYNIDQNGVPSSLGSTGAGARCAAPTK